MRTPPASFGPRARISTLLSAALVTLLSVSLAGGKPVAEQLKGHWGLDGNSMLAAMKEQLDQAGEDQRAIMEAQIKEMAEVITVQFGDEGKATLGSPEGEEVGTYKMEKVDEEAGTFTLTVVPEGKEGDSAAAKLDGDKLVITPPDLGQPMMFVRLTKEEYARRIALRKPVDQAPIPAPDAPQPDKEGSDEKPADEGK